MADEDNERTSAPDEDVFELFGDPPPEPDPARFGPIPVVRPDDEVDEEAPADAGPVPGGTQPPEAPSSAPVGPAETGAADGDDLALPHWSEPATGQVPKVLGGERSEDETWSGVSGPRWRGEEPAWADDDLADVFGDEEGVRRQPQVFSFDDVESDLADLPPVAGSPQRHDRVEGTSRRRAATPAADLVGPTDEADRNLGQAAVVGVALAAIAALAFLNPWTAVLLVMALAGLCAVELFKAMQDGGLRPATLLGITGVVALPWAVYARGEAAYPLVVFLLVAFGAIWYLVGADAHRPVANLGVTVFGIAYLGGLAGFAALMLRLPNGVGILLAAVIATVAADVGAYAVGRAVGSRGGGRHLSRFSPGKTWEGAIGGLIAAVVVSFLVVGLIAEGITPFGGPDGVLMHTIWLGLVVGVVAPVGDLTESLIKRDLGVKDMGGLLPGHGGILDRVDGILFALPAVYYLARILELS
jgi:phosphatidate cytidylyltransferase